MHADYKKGDKEISLTELIGLIKNHEYATFTTIGLGETVIETILFKQVVEELKHREKGIAVVEFHEPTYYIGCGNCEAEVVGKYCSECGVKLIYESEGE